LFKGIRRHIIVHYLLVIAVIVFLMGTLFVWFLNYFYMQNLRENLYNQARLTAVLIEEMAGRNAGPEEIDNLSKTLGRELNIRITLIDEHGAVLADSAENPANMENHGSRPEIIEALEQDKGIATRYSTTLDEQMFYLAIPLEVSFTEESSDSRAALRLALPLMAINRVISSFFLYILAALLISSVVALVTAVIISSRITGPIEKISNASREIAKGNFYPDLEVSGKDELSGLADNINKMGQALDKKIAQVVFEKNKFETVVSSMTSGIIFVDSDLKVELVNPAAEELFDVEKAKVIGSPVQNTVRYYALYENLKTVWLDGKPRMLEMNLYYPRSAVLETYILPVVDADNKASGILLVFYEVTHLRSLEKMRSDFVANVSHELRTPLTTVRGYTETILSEDLSTDQLMDFLKIIDRETKRLSGLLDELLDLSRIENEKGFVRKEKIDLGSLVNEATERVEELAQQKNFKISYQGFNLNLKIMGNHEWLCQALVNILENSIKHGNPGGRIMIKMQPEGDNALVEISDNGPGIPESDLPYIFERFYRVDKSRSRKSGSTGLGLSIVKHIMEAHGAEYSIESIPDQGTTFRFFLPLNLGH
jgi:two-component system, OmpR family, phosphate regulon sensor histidine kinase PhoR